MYVVNNLKPPVEQNMSMENPPVLKLPILSKIHRHKSWKHRIPPSPKTTRTQKTMIRLVQHDMRKGGCRQRSTVVVHQPMVMKTRSNWLKMGVKPM